MFYEAVMKKIICIIISVMLLLSVFVISASADDAAVITVAGEKYNAGIGDTLIYNVELQSDEGILCGEVQAFYPESIMTAVGVTSYTVKNCIKNLEVAGEVNANFSNTKAADFSEKKAFLQVKFNVIAAGEGAISFAPIELYNSSQKPITANVNSYESLTVEKAPTNPTTEPETTVPVSEPDTTLPVDETTVPASEDDTTAPVDDTTVPVDETTIPASESETTAPVDETTVPVDETTLPETTVYTSEPVTGTEQPTTTAEVTTEATESIAERIKSLKQSLMNEVADASMGIVEGVECRGDNYLNYEAFDAAYKTANQLLGNENATVSELEEALKNLTEARKNLVWVESITAVITTQPTTDAAETTNPAGTTQNVTTIPVTTPVETTVPVTIPVVTDPTEATAPKKADPKEELQKLINSAKGNNDLKNSVFGSLKAKCVWVKKNAAMLSWNIKNGLKYFIYGGELAKKPTLLRSPTSSGHAIKGLKKNTAYRFFIAAYNRSGKITSISKNIFVFNGGKKSNYVKSVKVNTKSKTLKVKKSFKLKAKEVLKYKGKKLKRYRKLRYESSNKKIAAVTSKGKVKAKKKGKAYIYVYSQNGTFAKVKIKVK